ncbi:MAG TPA: phosphate ABC transporter permease PstA [Solirubrobacterales bacterium]|nr:phosphate ABC transporter permease PstA [Solirubrobacterales bacterium]
MSDASFDPAAPLTPSGNLRRRRAFSRLAEYGATAAALAAVGVLGIVIFAVVVHGASALSLDFLFKGAPDGIGPELVGTAEIVAIGTLIAAPIGILVAVYLTEFGTGRLAAWIKLTLDLMNGLPSIVVGLFVFGLIVEATHKQSGFAGSVALAIIMLPIVARGTMEILLLVPASLREAADALGVSRWRSVLGVILPSAIGGILTATVLAVARAAGETAPLLLLTSVYDPSRVSLNPFEALPNIPTTIFRLSEEASPEGFTQAWGAGLVLLTFIMITSIGARILLARTRSKMAQ